MSTVLELPDPDLDKVKWALTLANLKGVSDDTVKLLDHYAYHWGSPLVGKLERQYALQKAEALTARLNGGDAK